MGNRANVVLHGHDQPADLILYTHWRGAEVETVVRQGIALAIETGRTDDYPYAQRCIVDTFFRAHASTYADGTGAGIHVGHPFEANTIRVDLDKGTVTTPNGGTRTFAEFIA